MPESVSATLQRIRLEADCLPGASPLLDSIDEAAKAALGVLTTARELILETMKAHSHIAAQRIEVDGELAPPTCARCYAPKPCREYQNAEALLGLIGDPNKDTP